MSDQHIINAVKPTPLWHLSTLYFMYFGVFGLFVPLMPLYLKSIGMTPTDIGALISAMMVGKLITPFASAWLADAVNAPTRLIQALLLMALFSAIALLYKTEYQQLYLIMLLYGLGLHGALPIIENLTINNVALQQAHGSKQHYADIRLWGSVGFIASSMLFPNLLAGSNIVYYPTTLLALLVLLMLSSWLIKPTHSPAHKASQQSIWTVIRQPYIVSFLLATALLGVSHGTYYTFYSIHLQNLAYDKMAISLLWSLGVAAEVLLFIFASRILDRTQFNRYFIIALGLAGVRWIILATLSQHLSALIVAQLLHAASFGLFHLATIDIVHHYFKGRLQIRGQALNAAVNYGLGGVVGSLMGGIAWEYIGASGSFIFAATIAWLGLIIALIGMRASPQTS